MINLNKKNLFEIVYNFLQTSSDIFQYIKLD